MMKPSNYAKSHHVEILSWPLDFLHLNMLMEFVDYWQQYSMHLSPNETTIVTCGEPPNT